MLYENYITNFMVTLNLFYKDFGKANFKNITKEQLENVIAVSKLLNPYIKENDLSHIKARKYIKVVERIRNAPKKYNLTTNAEKLLLLMLSVDSNFETYIIYGESNTIYEIEKKMRLKFGLFDKNLIKIEKVFINCYLNKKKKSMLDEEIEKRVYK